MLSEADRRKFPTLIETSENFGGTSATELRELFAQRDALLGAAKRARSCTGHHLTCRAANGSREPCECFQAELTEAIARVQSPEAK